MVQDFSKAIEVAPDTFWVSVRDTSTLLHVNVYLRKFSSQGKTINLLVDPGPLELFTDISRKIGSVIKDVSNVNMYSINHQDPDVGMNATFLSKINQRSICLCSEDTWRLVRFFEIPSRNYKNVYTFDNNMVTLSTSQNHGIEFVPTPYCHFVGAYALYDRENRTLFTGDLFGGLSPANNLDLFATEAHWEGMKLFHQIYMPSKKAVQNAIQNIRKLNPPPLKIIPQHGAILEGELMEAFMNRLYNLDMGMDLFDQPDTSGQISSYQEMINTLFTRFKDEVGMEASNHLFQFNNKNQELFYLMDLDPNEGVKSIYSQPAKALNLFLTKIDSYPERGIVNEIKSLAIKESLILRLPLPMNNLYGSAPEEEGPVHFEQDSLSQNDNIFA